MKISPKGLLLPLPEATLSSPPVLLKGVENWAPWEKEKSFALYTFYTFTRWEANLICHCFAEAGHNTQSGMKFGLKIRKNSENVWAYSSFLQNHVFMDFFSDNLAADRNRSFLTGGAISGSCDCQNRHHVLVKNDQMTLKWVIESKISPRAWLNGLEFWFIRES